MSAPDPALLDVPGAAAYLSVRQSYVRRLIRERRVTVIRIGRLVRFERAALDALIDAGRGAAR